MASTHSTQPLDAPTPTPPARRPIRLAVVVVLVILVLALALAAVRLTTGDDSGEQRVAIPLGDREQVAMQIDSGADSIVVATADLGDDLVVVTTPGGQDSGVRPQASLDGDRLRVWTENTGDPDEGASVQIDVRVARGVRLSVVVEKGAREVRMGLGTGSVSSVELRGGAELADVTLPEPVGEQTLRIPTGLATIAVHAPPAIPAKVAFGSGAGRAVVDGAERQGIAAGITIFGVNGKTGKGGESGYNAAKDRLLVDVSAGVGTLTLDRGQP